jgi:uncharacterized protein (DUF1778 family)
MWLPYKTTPSMWPWHRPRYGTSGQVVVGNKNWPSTVYGGNEQYLDIKKYTVESGRNFTPAEVRSMAKVCLVGQTIIENLFEKGADPIGQTIRFGKVPLKIIGVLADKGENSFGQDQDDAVIAPYTTVQRRIMAVDHIQSIQTSATSEEESNLAIAEIQSILRKQHKITNPDDDDFRVMSQAELVKTFSSISDILTTFCVCTEYLRIFVEILTVMKTTIKEQARFDARLPKEQKQFFERAAYLGGFRNLTDFVIIAVQEKAKEIIKEKEQIIASEKDSQIFFDAITKPKKPSETLKKALDDYNAFVSGSK